MFGSRYFILALRRLLHQGRILLFGGGRDPVRIGDLAAARAVPRGGLAQTSLAEVGDNAIDGFLALAKALADFALGDGEETLVDLIACGVHDQATLSRRQMVGTLASARRHLLALFSGEIGLRVLEGAVPGCSHRNPSVIGQLP